jgi:helix-turn-helix, Psq domain
MTFIDPQLPYNARVELALTKLAKLEVPTFRPIARKYNINYTTLSRRFRGKQVSRAVTSAEIH